MKCIEEKIKVFAPVHVIWKAWSDNYLQTGFKVGKKSHVMSDKKKKVKFKILEVKKNDSLTILWYSFMVKIVFQHKIEPIKNGNLVICRVNLQGFLAFIIKPFIENKVRNYLQISLRQFARNLNT
jgi:hypothetical protein